MRIERSSGVLLHPTSLPGNFGIGDLGKYAYEFIDFLKSAQQRIWQVLPLTPTSFGDSPYQSFSTFAFNPLLISPEILVEKGYLSESDLNDIPEFDPSSIDYGAVIIYKNNLYKKAYQNFKNTSQAANTATGKEFAEFCKKNKGWLNDYALFVAIKEFFIEERRHAGYTPEFEAYEKANKKYLSESEIKDYYFGAVWNSWPMSIAKRDPAAMSEWTEKLREDIDYHMFLQFESIRQWMAVKQYANDSDIKIIGDIPIFVACDSADTWANPKMYHFDESGYPTSVAGVPPDYFSATGQLWGNPLYDWDAHKKENYRWWKNRIKSVLEVVDIVRIDHFRGFEAYWSVPFGEKTAIGGTWVKGPGKDLFVAIESELGKLPIIAEDLGLITKEVQTLRTDFDFPGMRVLQFAFDSDGTNEYLPHNYDSNTVVYTGTHDNDTTSSWYHTSDEKSRDMFRRYMNVNGYDAAWDMIRLAESSVADLAIVPMQDIFALGSDARMNTPGTSGTSWKWRYTVKMLNTNYAERLAAFTVLFNRCAQKKDME